MKATIFSAIILLAGMPLLGQSDPVLPKQWDKTFVITISHTGSMSGFTSHLTFTFDSCNYESSSQQAAPQKKKFALSQADRDAILKKLREFRVDKIKEGLSIQVQNDGWSDVFCFGGNCIEGGSASEMTTKDKDIFLNATRYLEEFATTKR